MATKINLYETICTFKNDDYLTSGKKPPVNTLLYTEQVIELKN